MTVRQRNYYASKANISMLLLHDQAKNGLQTLAR